MDNLTPGELATLSLSTAACHLEDSAALAGESPLTGLALHRRYLLRFLAVDGGVQRRAADLYLPRNTPPPYALVIALHYELKPADPLMRLYLQKGWAVLTPVEIPPGHLAILAGDDLRFSNALISAALRWPFIDHQRVAVRGGSAGGYHVMLMSEHRLGLCAGHSQSGVYNLPYQFGAYIPKANSYNLKAACGMDEARRLDPAAYPIPYVKFIADTFAKLRVWLGEDITRGNWTLYSPAEYAAQIGQPLLLTHSTADAIVPLNQLSERLSRAQPGPGMPSGFEMRLEQILPDGCTRLPFDALLPEDTMACSTIPPARRGQANLPRYEADKLLSVCVIDEGPVEPACSHVKDPAQILVDDTAFFESAFDRGASVTNRLTPERLAVLALRFQGKLPLWAAEQNHKSGAEPSVFGSLAGDRLDVLTELLVCLGTDIDAEVWEETAPLEAFHKLYQAMDCELQFLGPPRATALGQLEVCRTLYYHCESKEADA